METGKNMVSYETLLAAVQRRPTSIEAWRVLSEVSPALGASVAFSKLADFLQNNKVARSYIYLNEKNCDATYVTFVALAAPIFGRVDKAARVARAAGIKIQLILCFQPNADFVFDRALYEEIFIVHDVYLYLTEALKRIREFGSGLIHMFVDCVTNFKAAIWAIRSPLPLVGDAYDLSCAQYKFWVHDESAHISNAFFENIWLQHIDGLCLKNHYMKTKELQAAYCRGMPVYYMPDPARSEFSVYKNEKIDTSTVNILMDGLGANVPCYAEAYKEVFCNAKEAGNVHFYIYRYDGGDISEYGDMIHIYPRLPVSVFMQLMRKCDAFIIPWCPRYVDEAGYTKALTRYGTRNTASDIMEADIINIVPDYFELIGQNAIKCNRGLRFSQADQQSCDFWKSLPAKIAQLRQSPLRRHRFLDTTLAPHLKSFYQSVIRKVVRRQLDATKQDTEK